MSGKGRIADTFRTKSGPPPLSQDELVEIATLAMLIKNCFDPQWVSDWSGQLFLGLIQALPKASIAAFLDVMHEMHDNEVLDFDNLRQRRVVLVFTGTMPRYSGEVSEADLLRMARMLSWKDFLVRIPAVEIATLIARSGTAVLVPHLERALAIADPNRDDGVYITQAISACRSRP